MPSALKLRRGKPSAAEMLAQLGELRKPKARELDSIFKKYLQLCKISGQKTLTEIVVKEPVNWKALIMSLPPPQNTQVLGCGIRKILLKETDCVFEGIYRFHVERRDGTHACFDWREAYDDPYHSFKDKSYKDDIETALRAAVLYQLIEFKEMLAKDSQMELCSHLSGLVLSWEKAAVQYFPMTFNTLVDIFLNEVQVKIEDIKIEYCDQYAYRLKDTALLKAWQEFHRDRANYRIISVDEAMEQEHL